MERLTLDEAIRYIKEVVQKNRKNKEKHTIIIPNSFISSNDCAEKYEQVANWLEELKSYKEAEEQGLLVRVSRVKRRLEQFQKDLTSQTIYKEGLPGSALDIVNILIADLAADDGEEEG